MEAPFALILIVLGGLILAAPILTIVALRRTAAIRILEARLEELQLRLSGIDRRLRELQHRGVAPSPASSEPRPAAAPDPAAARTSMEDVLAGLTDPEPPRPPEPGTP